MKILIVGGTGIISAAVSRELINQGHELWLINRGSRKDISFPNAHILQCDISDTTFIQKQIASEYFDCIADFIIQKPEHIDRDYKLFSNHTKQYIFISSACIYQKPLSHYEITESTPIYNPYWDYAQNKIACEIRLQEIYRSTGFPITIIRPGHTYDEKWLPLAISGAHGCYSVIKRIKEEKSTIIPGDGTSLWTVTHNSDFARAFAGIVGNPRAIGETINISSDEVLTWNQIYQTIADVLNVPLHPFYISSMFLHNAGPYDFKCCLIGERAQSTVFKNEKLKHLVPDFHAKISFHQGITQSLSYLENHTKYQDEDPVFDRWCDRLEEILTQTAYKLNLEFPNWNEIV